MSRRSTLDTQLLVIALLLTAYGIAMVYSAGQTDVSVGYITNAYKRQLAWFVVALVAAYAASKASVRLLEWVTWPAFILSVLLLLVTLFIGTGAGTAASQKGWLGIGPARFQPAELAKVTVVLMLARVFAARRVAPKSLLELWRPALVVGIPWLLIMAQPDLGTAIVFIGIFFAMLFWSGVSWQLLVLVASPAVSLILAFTTGGVWGAWFLILVALILKYRPYLAEGVVLIMANVATGVVAPILWEQLAPYQQRRLLTFLDPSADPRASGWHVIQSQVAIGSGGLLGKGFGDGTQKRLAFLPAQHTDFIFAVLGEELGFIGVTIALTLFLALFMRTVRIAGRANDAFSSLVAFGLGASWFVHVAENVGMTLNLMPITGIPLPFFSYGGSFLVVCWMAVGILMRISTEGRGRGGALEI